TKAMEAALETIGVGVPQHVVAAEIQRAQTLGDEGAWGDFPAIVPMLPTGQSSDTPHLTWTDRPLLRDEAVIVELAGAHRRYHVPAARTVMLGRPTAELLRVEEAVAHGLQQVLDSTRAGVPVARLA